MRRLLPPLSGNKDSGRCRDPPGHSVRSSRARTQGARDSGGPARRTCAPGLPPPPPAARSACQPRRGLWKNMVHWGQAGLAALQTRTTLRGAPSPPVCPRQTPRLSVPESEGWPRHPHPRGLRENKEPRAFACLLRKRAASPSLSATEVAGAGGSGLFPSRRSAGGPGLSVRQLDSRRALLCWRPAPAVPTAGRACHTSGPGRLPLLSPRRLSSAWKGFGKLEPATCLKRPPCRPGGLPAPGAWSLPGLAGTGLHPAGVAQGPQWPATFAFFGCHQRLAAGPAARHGVDGPPQLRCTCARPSAPWQAGCRGAGRPAGRRPAAAAEWTAGAAWPGWPLITGCFPAPGGPAGRGLLHCQPAGPRRAQGCQSPDGHLRSVKGGWGREGRLPRIGREVTVNAICRRY